MVTAVNINQLQEAATQKIQQLQEVASAVVNDALYHQRIVNELIPTVQRSHTVGAALRRVWEFVKK